MLYSITLTIKDGAHRIAPMDRFFRITRSTDYPLMAIVSAALIFAIAVAVAGCGVAYQAGTRIKATRMSDTLQVGQTSPQVHHSWGEPDLRTYLPGDTEVWSYPYKPNSNDVVAALMYTSSKDGDKGTFLDLKFVGGKLVSWQEAEHTMPAKGHTGIGLGVGGGPIGNGTQTTPGAVHY
jgi:hypothetical protein